MGDRSKKTIKIIVAFVCMLFLNNTTWASCDQWAAKIASVQGKVEARRNNTSNWQATNLNDTFCAGDQIRVGSNSRAAIILANETLLRLDQNSAIKLTAVKPKQTSIIDLFKGIGHFISRVPRSLKVETPTMNAAIEGTEFVIAIHNNKTQLTVFEGTVLASNSAGKVKLTNGESAIATKNNTPSKLIIAKPRDAVQWALYYPPVLDPSLKTGDPVYRAAALLNKGRVKEANAILNKTPKSGANLALRSIIAVVNNNKSEALKLAQDAVQSSPNNVAAYIALSYAQQANFELEAALASSRQGTNKAPSSAIAWARVAELQLSLGMLDDALASAKLASEVNNKLSRVQTILGYAHLLQIDIEEASQAFNKAILLDQTDPLPRLGLGLAKIRNNDLKEGRREIEIAASLDPNNAIIRSYLGKAYFEEKRSPLDFDQFDMAKELDPYDPTPWFYDAIAKQSENRPGEALKSLQQSIKLNDNRAIYRSSLQLDEDEAARSSSLGRIYQDLGFEQRALIEGWKSVSSSPAEHSSHRLLADSYSALPRHEIARISELLQSQLFQPLNNKPIQPHLALTDLAILNGAGPSDTSLNEFNSLFSRDGLRFEAYGVGGSNKTEGNNIILSGLQGNSSFSIGQYKYQTDGYRSNNDLRHDIKNAFLQFGSNNTSIQLELTDRESSFGDRDQSIDGSYNEDKRRSIETTSQRIGLHHKPSVNSDLIFSLSDNRETDITNTVNNVGIVFPFPDPLIVYLDTTTNHDGYLAEAQYLLVGDQFNLITGAGHFSRNRIRTENSTVTTGGSTINSTSTTSEDDRQNNNVYVYSNLKATSNVTLTLGAAYDDFNSESIIKREKFSPKLGLIATTNNNLTFRFAAFSAVSRATLNSQTIEPTSIAGFNQFFDDFAGTVSKRIGTALDYSHSKDTSYGIEFSYRQLNTPVTGVDVEQDESLHRAYLFSQLSQNTSFGLSYIFDRFESKKEIVSQPVKVRTNIIPVNITYHFSGGFSAGLQATGVKQDVRVSSVEYQEKFWVTDVRLGYRFPNRMGSFDLLIKNISDKKFNYQSSSFRTSDQIAPSYIPEQTIYLNLSLLF